METRKIDKQHTNKISTNSQFTAGRAELDADNDGVLLNRIIAKDRRAFEQFYFRYHRQLYQFLFRIVKNPETAEELVNDVMYVVWDQAAKFKGHSKISTWVFGIAYRKALKECGHVKRRQQTLDDGPLPDLQDMGWSVCPEQWLANEEFAHALKRSIASLGAEHRSVVELTALGYTYKEISEVMDCPENTVKTRMFYARRGMKEFLAKVLVAEKH